MSFKSDFSFDQISQLVFSLRKNGWDKKDVTNLGQCGKGGSASIRDFLDGQAEIILIEKKNDLVLCAGVDGTSTAKKALNNLGSLEKYLDYDVVATMFHGGDDEVKVHFFKVGRSISDNDLEEEYRLNGLKPIDPYSLIAVNRIYPAFSKEYPNGTHWRDSSGMWCHCAFCSWYNHHSVVVNHNNSWWGSSPFWYAGFR